MNFSSVLCLTYFVYPNYTNELHSLAPRLGNPACISHRWAPVAPGLDGVGPEKAPEGPEKAPEGPGGDLRPGSWQNPLSRDQFPYYTPPWTIWATEVLKRRRGGSYPSLSAGTALERKPHCVKSIFFSISFSCEKNEAPDRENAGFVRVAVRSADPPALLVMTVLHALSRLLQTRQGGLGAAPGPEHLPVCQPTRFSFEMASRQTDSSSFLQRRARPAQGSADPLHGFYPQKYDSSTVRVLSPDVAAWLSDYPRLAKWRPLHYNSVIAI